MKRTGTERGQGEVCLKLVLALVPVAVEEEEEEPERTGSQSLR